MRIYREFETKNPSWRWKFGIMSLDKRWQMEIAMDAFFYHTGFVFVFAHNLILYVILLLNRSIKPLNMLRSNITRCIHFIITCQLTCGWSSFILVQGMCDKERPSLEFIVGGEQGYPKQRTCRSSGLLSYFNLWLGLVVVTTEHQWPIYSHTTIFGRSTV